MNVVVDWIKERWDRYQAKRKSDALWNKLHRYSVSGKPTKFLKKNYIKLWNRQKKQRRLSK
jgi:hypothetical protein